MRKNGLIQNMKTWQANFLRLPKCRSTKCHGAIAKILSASSPGDENEKTQKIEIMR